MPTPRPGLPKALSPLITLATVVLVVTVLARAQAVLLPVALALALAFVINGPVMALERRGLPRILAIGMVMTLVLGLIGGFGWVLQRQVRDLSAELPRYTNQMRAKVASLREGGRGALDIIQRTVESVGKELDERGDETRKAVSVKVVEEKPVLMDRLREWVGPLVDPLAGTLIVLVLTVFMVSQREDLRDRILRLMGARNANVTTRTMDEAAGRIGRYLLSQTAVNATYGLVIAGGLTLIHVPYAPLWGFVAAVLRFVPYVGAFLAMLIPTSLAFVLFPTWRETFATVGLYLGLDAVTAYFAEPIFIGQRTGVSSLALLVSTIFWVWLWGPSALVLSTPLTVCLAVLGRHVPQLGFLGVLLGDQPSLNAEVSYYQRLLTRDEDEAAEVVEHTRGDRPPAEAMDEVMVPALSLAARDLAVGEISEDDAAFVLDATREIALHVGPGVPALDRSARWTVGISARSGGDEVLLRLLAKALESAGVRMDVVEGELLTTETLDALERRGPGVVCVGSLPPGGGVQARSLVQRLRSRMPEVPILVLRPTLEQMSGDLTSSRLRTAGADRVVGRITEAVAQTTELVARDPGAERPAPH